MNYTRKLTGSQETRVDCVISIDEHTQLSPEEALLLITYHPVIMGTTDTNGIGSIIIHLSESQKYGFDISMDRFRLVLHVSRFP